MTSVQLPGVLIDPQGQTATISITSGPTGGTPIVYSDPFAVTPVSLPHSISTPTKFYLPTEGQYVVNGQSFTVEGTQVATVTLPTANFYTDQTTVYLSNPKYGARLDGVHDDSAAFADAAADTLQGGTLVLPPKPILLASNQLINQAINIRGSGWWCASNVVFGNAQWGIAQYGTNFGGTVLYFTATSGTALTLGPPTSSNLNQSAIQDAMMLGPGTGTGTGLLLQEMVTPHVGGNVLVANFHDGITTNGLESCSANAFKTRGCFNGIALTNATNNCVLNGWGADTCSAAGTGLSVPSAGVQGTVLYGFESQGNLGAIASLVGCDGLTIGPGSYFENVGAASGITISAGTVYIDGIIRGTPADTITISGGVVTMTASRGSPAITVTSGTLYTIGDIQATPSVSGGSWWRLMAPSGSNNNLPSGIAIPAGQQFMFNGPTDTNSAIGRDGGTGNTKINAGSGVTEILSALKIDSTPAFAAGDHYLVVDSSGNIHKSALGPAS